MLSRLAKVLLVATALAPMLVAFGLARVSEGYCVLAFETWQWFLYQVKLYRVSELTNLIDEIRRTGKVLEHS